MIADRGGSNRVEARHGKLAGSQQPSRMTLQPEFTIAGACRALYLCPVGPPRPSRTPLVRSVVGRQGGPLPHAAAARDEPRNSGGMPGPSGATIEPLAA